MNPLDRRRAFINRLLHEVRNPVNAILNASRLLSQEETAQSTKNELVQIIAEGANRIQRITEALDSHPRPAEAGEPRPCDVREGIQATLRLLQHRLNGIVVNQEYLTDRMALVSAGPINQVFLNLLGSEYFGEHPTVPLAMVAGGNIDGMGVIGRTRDVSVQGYGSSQLEERLRDAAARQGRVLQPEPTPEKGYYYRSDHFSLARHGVPMLYAKSGIDSVTHGAEWGLAQQADYVANRYHKPSDDFDPAWDLGGAIDDLQLYFDVLNGLAGDSDFPEWYPGNEFRPVRERSRAGAAP